MEGFKGRAVRDNEEVRRAEKAGENVGGLDFSTSGMILGGGGWSVFSKRGCSQDQRPVILELTDYSLALIHASASLVDHKLVLAHERKPSYSPGWPISSGLGPAINARL